MSADQMGRLGARVRARRDALGLSRKDIETRHGLSAQFVQDVESGRYGDVWLFRLLPLLGAVGLPVERAVTGLEPRYDRSGLIRHVNRGTTAASQEVADVSPAATDTTETRVRELEEENARLRARLEAQLLLIDQVQELFTTHARKTHAPPAKHVPARGRGRRSRG
jgi:transcriptional regulator with XRE-family HTH domain